MARKNSGNRIEKQETPRSVDAQTGITLLKKLIEKARDLISLPNLQDSDITAWSTTARDYLTRAFGSGSPNINSVINASGDDGLYAGMSEEEFVQYLRSGLNNKIKVLEHCIEQLETDIQLEQQAGTSYQVPTPRSVSNRVFVVHGHNNGVKESLARFLEKLKLEPIILHEQPNAGRTIIEKFSDYSDVDFAVILLTGDDEGRTNGTRELKSRARQNVIFEFGFFLGKLGRARVCALYEDNVEIPSDYQGVIFVPLDRQDRWKYDLAKELKNAGFRIDANLIL